MIYYNARSRCETQVPSHCIPWTIGRMLNWCTLKLYDKNQLSINLILTMRRFSGMSKYFVANRKHRYRPSVETTLGWELCQMIHYVCTGTVLNETWQPGSYQFYAVRVDPAVRTSATVTKIYFLHNFEVFTVKICIIHLNNSSPISSLKLSMNLRSNLRLNSNYNLRISIQPSDSLRFVVF